MEELGKNNCNIHQFNTPGSDMDTISLVINSIKYKRWRQNIESNGNKILKLDVLSVVSRSPGTWYVAFLDCLLLTLEGNQIARCLILRGESVVIVPLLQCINDEQFYTVMVEQRCISDGDLHISFPAGSVGDGKKRRIMACQELMEETGIKIVQQDLVKLSEKISLNSSFSDDIVYFYGFRKNVTREWLDSIDNRSSGLHEEGEYIRVRVFSLADCSKMSATSTLIGLRLVEKKFGITCYSR
ncbi:MAG: hypothetical protein LBK93_03845 [Rickettsiales bacterium]|jgi:8-oxo-dGTP pyrophosphatase MutT (NUDIX family)|nr:hypothetical protein [Rickettsiales bacterium]